ncbi:activity-regulated cytoskeleton associated protein 2-like [Teleopsis dalmanni]|uniref:activity-regulated cytoskeleton associated protein 2-like n=1 Tax=Teleopsis dalmanni TaxID=139649 RepID=UPI0018CF5141|nr:activity-regulated cytoskeleton associated protein 2-like [Teleopsis dalmanni]
MDENKTITLSQTELNQLIEKAIVDAIEKQTKTKGSFANCHISFEGKRDHDTVEEFISNVETYKETEQISDEDALKCLPLLFSGIASIWWQGIKKEVLTWNQGMELLRKHFSPAKAPFQIYFEIFQKCQDENTPIDTFICRKRALLSQLPADRHDEETELDLIFGLINIKYRKYIKRSSVKKFCELLEEGRLIESNETEAKAAYNLKVKTTKRCSNCHFRGHSAEDCRKRLQPGKDKDNSDKTN